MERFMIVDNRYQKMAEKEWGEKYEIIPSVSCSSLADPICAHPDMALFKTGDKEFICAPEVYLEYEKKLSPFGVKLTCGKTNLSCNYPCDIAYNVFKAKSFSMALFSSVDSEITAYLEKENIKKISVRQGYAKCSICAGDFWAITADEGLYQELKNEGLDVLKIPSGEIELSGYDYGFIGGASGVNDDGDVFFFGDLSSVSYGKLIYDFLKEKGVNIFEIKNSPLIDVGTIMFF